MSRSLTLAAVMAAGLLAGMNAMAADPTPAPAPPSAAPAAKPADNLSRILGGIRSVDTKARTITFSAFGGDDRTIAYDDNTRFMRDIPADVSEIKVGDTLRAFVLGAGDPAATAISPDFLNIVPAVDVDGPPFDGPFVPTEGVVKTLKPLTIVTADKKTIAITLTDRTVLSKSKDAAAADVSPSLFGSGIVKGTGAGSTLTELHLIQPPSQ